MGWKGTVRSIGAAVRAAERDAKRRQRELERQQKLYEKMEELQRAAYEVEVFENRIEIIKSMHKECSQQINWESISTSTEPIKPENLKKHENSSRLKVERFKPGFMDKILKRAETKKKRLEENIKLSIKRDELDYESAISNWEDQVRNWKERVNIAKQLVSGNADAKLKVIKDLNPFSEIVNLGSKISVSTDAKGIVEVTVHVHGDEIIPDESKSLLKSGKLSVKKMPKGTFNELYQDYVCSCILRVAREIYAIIPDDFVIITAVDRLLSSKTGHMEESPILSACIPRQTIDSLNMEKIDPSDSMDNFIHNMSFKKTTGFDPVPRVDISCLKAT